MSLTIIGALLVPTALAVTLFCPSYLLPLLVISSVFEGASVVNGRIGDFQFGIPPFYFVAICIAFRYALLLVDEPKIFLPAERPTGKLARLLVGFWAWSVASSFVLPHLFAGMEVYSPREGIDEQYIYQTPLSWSFSNLAQACYLTLDVVIVLYALCSIKTSAKKARLVGSFFYSAVAVALIGLSQGVASLLGWSFPYDVLNSNPVYSQGFDSMLGSYQRVSATFTEPSYAGAFLAAAAGGLLASYLSGKRGVWQFLLIMSLLVVLLTTTSTSGYAAFAITVFLLLIFFNPLISPKGHRHSYAKGWVAVLGVAFLGCLLLFLNGDLFQAAASSTLDKTDELSFVHRIASDSNALSLLRNTYGLGLGLGSNRPSSLLTALLSTVGIPGTVLLGVLFYRCYKVFPGRSGSSAVQLTFWALCGLLIAQILAVPDISFPVLWSILMIFMVQTNLSPSPAVAVTGGNKQFAQQSP